MTEDPGSDAPPTSQGYNNLELIDPALQSRDHEYLKPGQNSVKWRTCVGHLMEQRNVI